MTTAAVLHNFFSRELMVPYETNKMENLKVKRLPGTPSSLFENPWPRTTSNCKRQKRTKTRRFPTEDYMPFTIPSPIHYSSTAAAILYNTSCRSTISGSQTPLENLLLISWTGLHEIRTSSSHQKGRWVIKMTETIKHAFSVLPLKISLLLKILSVIISVHASTQM